MLIVAPFIALSAMLTIAVPLPAYLGTSTIEFHPLTLHRRAPPIFDAPDRHVPPHDKPETIARMEHHYNTQATPAQRGAQLVSAASHWAPVSHTQESMAISYHVGGTTASPIIGSLGHIHRDRPTPEVNLDNVRGFHRDEVKEASLQRFRDHDFLPGDVGRVKSIKVSGNWDRGRGMLDKTQMTFHSTPVPSDQNVIGHPITVRRPLTVQNNVPPWDKPSAEQAVRTAHGRMAADPNHRFSSANHVTIHSGWQDSEPDASGTTHEKVVAAFARVSEDETHIQNMGMTPILRNGHELKGTWLSNTEVLHPHVRPSDVLQHDQASNTGGVGPQPAASASSSEGSHHGPPGSDSDSETTSQLRLLPFKKRKWS